MNQSEIIFRRLGEGEPPGEPRDSKGSAEASPSQPMESKFFSSLGKFVFFPLLILLCLSARLEKADQVLMNGDIFFLDSDCYTRMFRVKLLWDQPWPLIHFHAFENYPYGISSHATAPLDYLILFLGKFLDLLQRKDALDLAGALISPLLGIGLLIFLLWWTKLFLPTQARVAALFAYCLFPALSWTQNIGRPDHQSLIIFCLTIAITLEANLARSLSRGTQIVAGAFWGLALWTSWYEPGLVFLVFLIVRLIQQRSYFLVSRPFWWLSLVIMLGIAFLFEGKNFFTFFNFFTQNLSTQPETLQRWFHQIGELQRLDAFRLTLWFGAWIWALPVLIYFAIRNHSYENKQIFWLSSIITLFLLVLTFWQMRWSGLLAVFTSLFIIPLLFRLPGHFWQWGVTLILSIPLIAYIFYTNSRPSTQYEFQNLKKIAEEIKTSEGVLAPWWQSPALLYYSGAPIIASSSHESLSGIIDSSKFFTSVNWIESEKFLKERQVRWIVVGDPRQVLSQSFKILGIPEEEDKQGKRLKQYSSTLAARLYTVKAVPTALKLRAVIQPFRLYEYLPAAN
ncbi:MAG: hypothetical protein K1X66_01985 [Verrucomicrobiae bacterium]|nr:hypothetical protein [Verrucomicrobiae bacterium]